jgi:hypothetical protein
VWLKTERFALINLQPSPAFIAEQKLIHGSPEKQKEKNKNKILLDKAL